MMTATPLGIRNLHNNHQVCRGRSSFICSTAIIFCWKFSSCSWTSSLRMKAAPRIPSIAILIWLSHGLTKRSIEAQVEWSRLRLSPSVRAPKVTSYEVCCTESPLWTVTMTLSSRLDMTSLTALPKMKFSIQNTWGSPTEKTFNSLQTYSCCPQIRGTHCPWFPSAAGAQ